MKKRYKLLLGILAVAMLLLVFRGPVYRACIHYRSVGERPSHYTLYDTDLVQYIQTQTGAEAPKNIADIIEMSLRLTARTLHFTAENNALDPNRLQHTQKAHCVGYAHYFSTVCKYLLMQQGLHHDWDVQVHIGKLYFWGIDLHRYFHSPFFRDHDFVLIQNTHTSETWAVDPTVYDYLHIGTVSLKNNVL